MYINFFSKIGLVRRSVKNRAHKSNCKNRKLHKFAATNSNFEKKKKIRHASS